MSILAECPYCHKKQSVRKKLCSCGADMDKLKGQKEKVKYWISYRVNGKQRRESVGSFEDLNAYSIEDAKKAEAKRKVQKAENRLMDVKPDSKMTFRELAEWYIGLEKVKTLASFWRIEMKLRQFNEVYGDKIVRNIKLTDLENYQIKRKKEGVSDSTVDQDMAIVKTMIIKAFDNDLVSGDTLKVFKKLKRLLKKGADVRDRILSPSEFDALMENSPKYMQPVIAAGYYAGMRKSEILTLTWDKVDLETRFIHLYAEDTKDSEDRDAPICNELFEILKDIPRAIHDNHVFLRDGEPIKYFDKALKAACKKAGIVHGRFKKGGFVFHDLRHTFNTNMRKAGVPESVIMAITGHATRSMFDRYNTIDHEDMKKGVDQLSEMLTKTLTKPENEADQNA